MEETLTDDELMSLLRNSLRDPEYARVQRSLNFRKVSVKTEAATTLSEELARKDAENAELRSICDGISKELAVTLGMLLNCEETISRVADESKEPRILTAEYERVKKELEEERNAGKAKNERILYLEKENMSIKSAYIDLEDTNFAAEEEVKVWKTKFAELETQIHSLLEENYQLKLKAGKKDDGLGNDGNVADDALVTPLVGKEPSLLSRFGASKGLDKKRLSGEIVDISDSDNENNNGSTAPASTSPDHGSKSTDKQKSNVFHIDLTYEGHDPLDSQEESLAIPTPKRRRGSRLVITDSESEDDRTPIGKLYRKDSESKDPKGKLCKNASERDEGVTPSKRRLVSLGQRQESQGEFRGKTDERPSAPDCQSSQVGNSCPRRTRRRLRYPTTGISEVDVTSRAEDIDDSASESEDESLNSFIVDESEESGSRSSSSDDASSENDNKHTFPGDSDEDEGSDSSLALDNVLAKMRRETKSSNWEYEADMLAAFAADPELCMQAVCALYRMQTVEEQSFKASLDNNLRGFSKLDACRGSQIAEFLLNGDPRGPIKKSVEDLKKYDAEGVEFCHKLATKYSKQLFNIYRNREDPHFCPP